MTTNQQKAIARYAKNEPFNRGQHIFVQGQKPEKVYIVIDGEFEILRNMKN